MMNFKIFDELDEYVYVSDMQTYEIVYANQKVLKNFGYNNFSDVHGMKCYQLLHRFTEPCAFCNNCKLNDQDVYEWNITNGLINRQFQIRDSVIYDNGRRLRLEIAKSLTGLDDEKKTLELQEHFIDCAFGIASKAVDVDESIDIFLEMIGKYIQADRAYIFENNDSYITNTYEWCKDGVTHEKQNLQRVDRSIVDVWFDCFASEGEFYIENLENIKDIYPDMYSGLKIQNITNLMVRPIIVNGVVIGFYGVDNMNIDLVHEIRSVLGLVSAFISVLFEKRNYIRFIQHSGSYDYLTNILNRNFASQKINSLLKESRGTLILIDLDNFKSVNDVFGHNMGDEVLKLAAHKMESVTRETDVVFRLGGDEFGIFFPSMTKREIVEAKCDRLLEKLNIDVEREGTLIHVSCSIGVCISDSTECTFSKLYIKADEELYKAKNAGKNRYSIIDA